MFKESLQKALGDSSNAIITIQMKEDENFVKL